MTKGTTIEITRFVKMEFMPSFLPDFEVLMLEVEHQIRAFPGCLFLEVLYEIGHGNTIFTHSKWDSVDALERYRKSDLFKETWERTKVGFNAKPLAWTFQ